METNVNYTIVGIFVITLVAAIVLGVIWLSSGFSFEKYSTYAAYMQESVSGLNLDSPVEFNGVNVGTVKKIEINHQNPKLVELQLSIKNSTPITQGTVATLNSRGVTGFAYVALIDKGTDLTPLKKQRGQPYPVIKTSPSLFMRLDTALSQLSKNLRQVAHSIESVLDPQNQQSIKTTLLNLRSITDTLAANNQKLNAILENTARASRQFTPLVQSSSGVMKTLETQTLPAAYQMLSNLDNMTRTLSEVAVQIKQNPSILVRGVSHQTLGPGETK